MISLVEAKSYRCLRYVRQPLGNFHILVGPNASGKSTFLDVVAFLGDVLRHGVEDAVRRRARLGVGKKGYPWKSWRRKYARVSGLRGGKHGVRL